MQILILSGSRNPHGQTAQVVEAFARGCHENDVNEVQLETIFLPAQHIERCRQCDADGWGQCRREGTCVIVDDLEALRSKMAAADGVVFATPVYFGDLSESLKAFLDRVRRTSWRHQESSGIKDMPAVGICVAGGGGGGSFSCMVQLEKVLTTSGFAVVDQLSVRRQNLPLKLELARLTGCWFASDRLEP